MYLLFSLSPHFRSSSSGTPAILPFSPAMYLHSSDIFLSKQITLPEKNTILPEDCENLRRLLRLNRRDKVRNALIIICEHRRSEQEHLFGRLFSFSWFFVRSVVYLFFRSFGWSFPVRLVVFIRLFVRSLFARSVASVDNSPSHPRFYKQKSSETTTLGRKPVVIHIQVYILGHNQPI